MCAANALLARFPLTIRRSYSSVYTDAIWAVWSDHISLLCALALIDECACNMRVEHCDVACYGVGVMIAELVVHYNCIYLKFKRCV